jgi:hypothetical protein
MTSTWAGYRIPAAGHPQNVRQAPLTIKAEDTGDVAGLRPRAARSRKPA